MTDAILKAIAVKMNADGIANVTKYHRLQSVDITDENYTGILLSMISDTGNPTKDTSGSTDKEYNLRVQIYCKQASDKDTLYTAVNNSLNGVSGYDIQYDSKVDMYDDEEDMYQQNIEYRVWQIS